MDSAFTEAFGTVTVTHDMILSVKVAVRPHIFHSPVTPADLSTFTRTNHHISYIITGPG